MDESKVRSSSSSPANRDDGDKDRRTLTRRRWRWIPVDPPGKDPLVLSFMANLLSSPEPMRLRGVVFDVLIGRKSDNHMVRSFPELVCAGENTAGPGAQTVRRGDAGPLRRQHRADRLFFRICRSAGGIHPARRSRL
jgi:hypothetical protein